MKKFAAILMALCLAVSAFALAEEENGIAEVHVTVATEGIAGHTLVFFERLADDEGNTIATHADSEDEGQSIHFADIHTTAVDGDDGDKNVVADEKAKVVDTVSYENLIPGKEYVLEGKLVDKATGETLKDTDDERVRQRIFRVLVEELGYKAHSPNISPQKNST